MRMLLVSTRTRLAYSNITYITLRFLRIQRYQFSLKYTALSGYSMTMSKIITVFGATGNQGGSVITQLLNDSKISQEFKIRGITRDTSKPAAQELAKKGVEVVTVRRFEHIHLSCHVQY
jgi:hypothetical protein